MDARAVWGALTYRYVQSPAAHIMTLQLHNKITTSRLTTTYPGTYENYIDFFCRLLSDYDNLVTFEKRFTEDMKIDLLHNALGRDIPELALTMSQINISIHTSPVVLGFPYVISLYKMNCAHLDMVRKTSKTPCQINNAITSSPEHEEDTNNDHLDDLDLQVYAARRQRSARLSSELWKSLSPDEQKAWDSLSMEHKAAILKFGSTIMPTPTRNTQQSSLLTLHPIPIRRKTTMPQTTIRHPSVSTKRRLHLPLAHLILRVLPQRLSPACWVLQRPRKIVRSMCTLRIPLTYSTPSPMPPPPSHMAPLLIVVQTED